MDLLMYTIVSCQYTIVNYTIVYQLKCFTSVDNCVPPS